MFKELLVIQVERVVDKKGIIVKNGGTRMGRGTRDRWIKFTMSVTYRNEKKGSFLSVGFLTRILT
jgi:hypothetical protein